jgi:hypothetical protein
MVLPIIVAITLSLNKYTFGCTDVGVNTVIPTVTDSQGNTATCATKIRVDALPLIVEHLRGYNVQTKADAADYRNNGLSLSIVRETL